MSHVRGVTVEMIQTGISTQQNSDLTEVLIIAVANRYPVLSYSRLTTYTLHPEPSTAKAKALHPAPRR